MQYFGSGYFPTNNLNRCHVGLEYANQDQNASDRWSADTDINMLYDCATTHVWIIYADFGELTQWAGKAYICNTDGQCDNNEAFNGTYASCQVRLNSHWISGNPLYTDDEVQKLIMHELGHCYSLAHSNDPTSVMGGSSVPNAVDIMLINARY